MGCCAVVCSLRCCAQDDGRDVQLPPPQERVVAVRPFWETLTQVGRQQLREVSCSVPHMLLAYALPRMAQGVGL